MDKAALLAMSVPTEEFEIEGVGIITLRGMTRYEMMLVFKRQESTGELSAEQFSLSIGIVDPKMTEDDIAAWQKVAPGGLLNKIAMRVNALSGIGKDAAKSDVSRDGERSDD
jgi:hypothetical protein